MSKYRIWTIDDIKQEISKLENITGFKLDSNVTIAINNKLRKTLGICVYHRDSEYRNIVTSLEFSKYLVDGTVCEDEVLDTIIHEFIHAKVENGYKGSHGHNDIWKNEFIKYGGNGKSVYDGNEFSCYKEDDYIYTITCNNCGNVHNSVKQVFGNYFNNKHCSKCKSNNLVIKDVSNISMKVKIIKKYITEEIYGNNRGELKVSNLGTKYRTRNVPSGYYAKLIFRKTDFGLKLTLSNKYKLPDTVCDLEPIYKSIYDYLNNKDIFKFIDKIEKNSEDNLNLYINFNNLDLSKI